MEKRKALFKLGIYSTLLFSICSCSSNTDGEIVKPKVEKTEEATSNSDIWGTFGAEKIVQDRQREYYSDKVQDTKIDILTCKGESELDQIVISPSKKVNYFDARITDLKTSSGDTLSKENIELFACKYLKIDYIYDVATNETKGNFPDALIPIEGLLRDKTNYINEGANQSFYVKVNTPLNQKAGLYTGTLFIQLDNTEYKVNVTVDVKNYEVSSVTHSKSLFLNDWQFDSGENDASQDKLDAYNEELLKYRLSPDKLIRQRDMYSNFDSDFIYRYTEKAYEYMQNDNCTNVSIPYNAIVVKVDDSTYYQNIDSEKFKDFIRSYYVKSISTNYNMFKKSSFYCGIIDEPDDRDIHGQTALVVNTFNQAIKEVADELEVQGYTSNPLHNELILDIRELKNIVTCAYADVYDPLIECWCPKVNFYNTPEQRLNYANQKEKWWYTCVMPRAPFPTYHIEDGLTSSRALSWMQAEYDVVGNLFWATNVYAKYNGEQYIPIEDYYNDGYRFPGVNGDGFLFYPGEPLGFDHPLGCIRLESIRDGLEEYEMFYDLKNTMSSLELDDAGLFSFFNQNLYRGTKVIGQTKEMENARKELIDLLLANKNGSSFTISGYNVNEDEGQVELQFYANEGASIKFNNVLLTPTSTYKQGKLYSVVQKLENDTNIGKIDVTYNGATNSIVHDFGGKIVTINASDLVNGFSKYNAGVSSSISTISGKEFVKISVGEVTGKRQTIKYAPSFLSQITNKTKGLSFAFKNVFNNDINLSIGVKLKNKRAEQYLTQNQTIFAKSDTNIEMDMSGLSLDISGDIEYLVFVFGEDVSEGVKAAVITYLEKAIISY